MKSRCTKTPKIKLLAKANSRAKANARASAKRNAKVIAEFNDGPPHTPEQLNGGAQASREILGQVILLGMLCSAAKEQRVPSPGEGYRLLAPGEVIKEGDECYYAGAWEKRVADCFGREQMPHWLPTRRKVEQPVKEENPAGEGFRLLEPDEIVQEGDHFWSTHHQKWCPVGLDVGQTESDFEYPHRRPVAPPVKEEVTAGEGYRLLGPDEVIQEGDEAYVVCRKTWVPVHFDIGSKQKTFDYPHRRRVAAETPSSENQSIVNIYGLDYVVPSPVAQYLGEIKKALAASTAQQCACRAHPASSNWSGLYR